MKLLIDLLRPLQFRGKYRLLSPITGHRGSAPVSVFGARMDLDLSDFIQRNIYMGTFERDETRTVRNCLREGMCFVDVGANVGYFTAMAASLVGSGGTVYAFEPSPRAFASLSRMIATNGWGNVTGINCGLGSENRTVELYLGDESNHTPTMIPHGKPSIAQVEVRTLDAELDRLAVSKVDLMKVDVEGFEPDVLRGGRMSLQAGRIERLLVEFNDSWLERNGSSGQHLALQCEELGFELERHFGLNRLYRHRTAQ